MKRILVAFVVVVVAVVLVFALSSGDRWFKEPVSLQPADSGEVGSKSVPSMAPAETAGVDEPGDSPSTPASSVPFAAAPSAPPTAWSERIRELEFSARSDPNALGEISSFRTACQYWLQNQQAQDESARAKQAEWAVLEEICAGNAIARFDEALASAAAQETMQDVMLQPWHHNARTAEEFAARDARLHDQMRRAASAAAVFTAAIVYFDYERFSQWAGPLRPRHLHDDRSYRFSRIGLDVAWMYACRLGFDCGPYAGMTLVECWETPGCVPGGAARQVVQMRRSPLELRLVDSMVERLMAERAGVGR